MAAGMHDAGLLAGPLRGRLRLEGQVDLPRRPEGRPCRTAAPPPARASLREGDPPHRSSRRRSSPRSRASAAHPRRSSRCGPRCCRAPDARESRDARRHLRQDRIRGLVDGQVNRRRIHGRNYGALLGRVCGGGRNSHREERDEEEEMSLESHGVSRTADSNRGSGAPVPLGSYSFRTTPGFNRLARSAGMRHAIDGHQEQDRRHRGQGQRIVWRDAVEKTLEGARGQERGDEPAPRRPSR